jgi:hypothetical protein
MGLSGSSGVLFPKIRMSSFFELMRGFNSSGAPASHFNISFFPENSYEPFVDLNWCRTKAHVPVLRKFYEYGGLKRYAKRDDGNGTGKIGRVPFTNDSDSHLVPFTHLSEPNFLTLRLSRCADRGPYF